MFTIENTVLKVSVAPQGAEIQSIVNKKKQLEYMWSGDPGVWGKKSPVLFPIVGTLKENRYTYEGKSFSMGRHGFGRESAFSLEEQSADALLFLLENDSNTAGVYPFLFKFYIGYRLEGDTLHTTYRVKNTGDGPLYFSVGGHPAFKVPLLDADEYTDYELVFNETEDAPRWPVAKDGLIAREPTAFFNNSNVISIHKDLFQNDALVFKGLRSTAVTLRSKKTQEGCRIDFPGFPFLGIWAAPCADFVCIEPWCGIADSVDSNQDLTVKEGILSLPPAQVFERTWSFSVVN